MIPRPVMYAYVLGWLSGFGMAVLVVGLAVALFLQSHLGGRLLRR